MNFLIDKYLSLTEKQQNLLMLSIFPVIVSLAMMLAYPKYQLHINVTDSLPGFVYFLKTTNSVDCGDTVIFKMPKNVPYYSEKFLMKHLTGCPGDLVNVRNRDVYINNLFAGHAKVKSRNGAPLHVITEGTIPDGFYYVWSPNVDSYDSRYSEMGLVSEKLMVGKAHRIL